VKGTIKWPEPNPKTRYEGECVRGVPDGKGKMSYRIEPGYPWYTGEFKNGKRDGQGEYHDQLKGTEVGVWKEDVMTELNEFRQVPKPIVNGQ
jgi:hypothetical protein